MHAAKYSGKFEAIHTEIVETCESQANAFLGEAIRKDRKSELNYLGLRVPVIRSIAKTGFSFYEKPEDEILLIWNDLWNNSPYGEVLFLAIEYYLPRARKQVKAEQWPTFLAWHSRVDNWAHCDGLCSLYSRFLEAEFELVIPSIKQMNVSDDLWEKRISIVSLVHYTGKNSVFLKPPIVLSLVEPCLGDERDKIQKAIGWVLREMFTAYPEEVGDFLRTKCSSIGNFAFSRAISKCTAEEKKDWKDFRLRSR